MVLNLNLKQGREQDGWKEQTMIFFVLVQLPSYYFFQIRKRLILSDKGQLDWKKMYFKLIRCYPRKEQYGDTLQLCRHCHILSWKVGGGGGAKLVGHPGLPLTSCHPKEAAVPLPCMIGCFPTSQSSLNY